MPRRTARPVPRRFVRRQYQWFRLSDPHIHWIDMDLSGWSIGGGISFEFAEGTVMPGGGYLVVAVSPAAQPVNSVAARMEQANRAIGRVGNFIKSDATTISECCTRQDPGQRPGRCGISCKSRASNRSAAVRNARNTQLSPCACARRLGHAARFTCNAAVPGTNGVSGLWVPIRHFAPSSGGPRADRVSVANPLTNRCYD